MEEKPTLIDLNTADIEGLQTLPGIGRTMAERIIAARPFSTVDDLKRVSGIGQVAIERWRPLIAPPEIEQEAVGEIGEAAEAPLEMEPSVEGEPVVAEEMEAEVLPEVEIEELPAEPEAELEAQAVEIAPEETPMEEQKPQEVPVTPVAQAAPVEPRSKTFTRGQVGWLVFWSSLFTFLLAIAVSMGLLALINGGLQYANPAQVSTLRRQVDGLNAQAETLGQDIGTLRTRMDQLEGLSGRVGEVEKTTSQLRSDFNDISSQVSELSGNITELTGTVEELQARTGVFEKFLNGMRDLINGLFGPNK